MTTVILQLLFQLVLIFLNAIFACAEIAVLQVGDAKISHLVEDGNKKAVKLSKLTQQPEKFLSTIQVAITLSGFLGSAFAADNFSSRLVDLVVKAGANVNPETLDKIAVVIITLILSYITLVFGELVPKRLAMRKSEEISLSLAGSLYGISKIFTPVVWLLSVSTNGVLRMLGIDPKETDEKVSEEDIMLMVDEGSQKGTIDASEQELIENVFKFDDLTVSDFATHRTEITVLWKDDDVDTWEEEIHRSRHSFYPVCGETMDDIIGVLNIKDFFRLRGQSKEQLLNEVVLPAYLVPEGTHADILFRHMREKKQKFAIVLDEYGGMYGIVTMNDLLEQLVGELNDTDDEPDEEPDIIKTGENTWQIKGLAPLSDVSEKLEIELPEDTYDTMSGYVLAAYGSIPEDGTTFSLDIDNLKVTVTEISEHRIEKMTVEVIPQENEEEEE